MKIVVADSYAELSKQVADDIIASARSIKNPLICTASGDSPAGLYKELAERVFNKSLDISQWNFVGLDEWAGMNEEDEGSCKFHLNKQFFTPLNIAKERICFFDGRAIDMNEECRRIDNFIHQHNGIDIAIIGLGMNGHIGMNEPGTSAGLHSHIADIDPLTQQVGQKYFTKQQQLSHGLTLGIASLMEARKLVLIVSGAHKAEIVQKVLHDEISEQLPASLLRNHPDCTLYLDKEAAKLIAD